MKRGSISLLAEPRDAYCAIRISPLLSCHSSLGLILPLPSIPGAPLPKLGGDKTAVGELRAMFVAHPDSAQRMWSAARTQRYELAQRNCAPDDLLYPELFIAQAEAM